jgi:acyl transferase domain-containing protein
MVLLKRLSDALADRDHIRAVILATAVTNDGGTSVGFAAPSVRGQAAVIAEAMSLAGVRSQDVSMVEAHAVGSPLGDQIEVAALTSAFRRQGEPVPGGCALGSVKGNIGHVGRAAGVASLIKVALALENETIPPSGGFTEPNPDLRLAESPFFVAGEAIPWPRQRERPRYASLNAFGYGGSNAHAVLTEAPAPVRVTVPATPRVVVWSARTPQAADAYRERLAAHFSDANRADPTAFASAVATLQHGRTGYACRGAVVAADAREAAAALRSRPAVARPATPDDGGRVVMLFPGLDAGHAGMANGLADRSPAFAKSLDECLDLFEAEGVPARRAWRDGDGVTGVTAEPLVFAVSFALAQVWQSWGINPAAVLGHGVGELTAATVAGVFSLADAVRLVAVRSRAIAQTPPGGVLVVAGAVQDVRPLLPDGAAVVAVNGPRQIAVAGAAEVLGETVAAIEAAGLRYRRLPTDRAPHHWLVSPVVPLLERQLRPVELSMPTVEVFSAAAGRMLTEAEATDPGFWARQVAQPLQFSAALSAVVADPARLVLLEVGPGRTLTALARQQPAVRDGRHQVLPTLPAGRTDPPENWRSVLEAAAGLWTEGLTPDWAAVENLSALGRVPVPGYPYQRQRYWVEAAPQPVVGAPAEPTAGAPRTAAEPTDGAPRSGTTDRLRLLWAELLGHPDVGPDADFFDLGGNSLTALELMSRVRRELGVTLGVEALFDEPTPAGLAGRIDEGKW